jgi:hypothetical protein
VKVPTYDWKAAAGSGGDRVAEAGGAPRHSLAVLHIRGVDRISLDYRRWLVEILENYAATF